MSFPLLNISPSQLEFLFEAERELKSSLSLRNIHEGVRVAFKIKTTNSERFVVCPPSGIVEPGTTRIVKVYLRAEKDYDDELRFCKDRFLVQSIVVDHTMDEQDVTSSLFKSGQRQEAKLKVVVAAPLAHSSVLENEIRTIAMRQGVEGHRAVVRKFSELLLARGIISQAQVVLAFSTVGEIFQGMQSAYKATTAERERTFQQFLEGKGSAPIIPEATPSAPALVSASDSDKSVSTVPSLTFPKAGSPLSTAELPPLSRNPASEPLPESQPNKPAASSPTAEKAQSEPIKAASFSPTAQKAGKAVTFSPTVEEGPNAVPASPRRGAKQAETGSTAVSPVAPTTPSTGAAAAKGPSAPPSESTSPRHPTMGFSQLVSNPARSLELGVSVSPKSLEANSPAKPSWNHDALDALFDANGDRIAEDKAEVNPESHLIEVANSGAKRHLDFQRTAAPVSDSAAKIAVDTTGKSADSAAKVPNRTSSLGSRSSSKLPKASSRSRLTIGELIQAPTEPDTPSPTSHAKPAADMADGSTETLSSIPLLTEVHDELVAAREAAAEDTARQKAGLQGINSSQIPPETELSNEKVERPASGKSSWPKDSLGRLNPVTAIDRLATPAIRKSAIPNATKRMDAVLANGATSSRPSEDHSTGPDLQNANSLGDKGISRAAESFEDGFTPFTPRSLDRSLEPQDSLRSNGSAGSGSLGVPIPSGNTLKMANLFNRSKQQQN